MKKLFYPLSVLTLIGCASGDLLPPQSKDVTSITLLNSATQQPIEEIQDSEKVQAIVTFINSLKNEWKEPSFGEPDDVFELRMYKGKNFAGNFAVGEDFFSRNHQLTWVQDAEQEQVVTFSKILSLDLRSMKIYIPCGNKVSAQLKSVTQDKEFENNEINLVDKKLLIQNYPNWCQTDVEGQTYRIYSNESNEFIVEMYEQISRFSGPFVKKI